MDHRLSLTLSLLLCCAPPVSAQESNYVERNYASGLQAFESGEFLSARNYWHRFLEASKRTPGFAPDLRYQETLDLYLELIDFTAIERKPVKKKAPTRRSRRRVRSHPIRQEDPRKKAVVLLKRAETAEANGQLEYALRLYQLAGKYSPDLAEIHGRIERLNKRID